MSAGAGQASLNSNWADTGGYLSPGIGKIVYNSPGPNNKLNLTYILQGATPNTDYTLGFNIQNPACNIPWFGVPVNIACHGGTVGDISDTEKHLYSGDAHN